MAVKTLLGVTLLILFVVKSEEPEGCSSLASWSEFRQVLREVVSEDNGGFGYNMYGSIVNRDGIVCQVVYSGENRGSQWPASRLIAASKASTANAFSMSELSQSTAALYHLTQPGGLLYGAQFTNPINTPVAYEGKSSLYGTSKDPMIGHKIGGVNVFAGGLALYNENNINVGGIGVSGDTPCADAIVVWKVRYLLELDYSPNDDQIIINDTSASPNCGNNNFTEILNLTNLNYPRRGGE